ncbi:MAG TPA: hypothetical protein VGD67_05985, partial [Pseudonocardiaceae bacterium]
MVSGWPFLVARGRTHGYRVLLAPPWLLDTAGALEDLAVPSDRPREAVLPTAAGPRAVIWVSAPVTAADLGVTTAGHDGAAAGHRGPVRDEHGRPLLLTHGVVSGGPVPPEVADLSASHRAAVATYRRVLADEAGFAMEPSEPLADSASVAGGVGPWAAAEGAGSQAVAGGAGFRAAAGGAGP